MPQKLKRCLPLWEIVVYGVGLILGAGIYVLIGNAAGLAGNLLWAAFLMAGIAAGFTAVSYSELSTAMPKSAAEYIFIREAFESQSLAWIIGIFGILVGLATVATVALGFAQYLTFFIPTETILLASGLIIFMSLISFWGIQQSAIFNLIATSIELGGLLLIIVIGGYQIWTKTLPSVDLFELPIASNQSTTSFFPVVSAGALIFFAFVGFEDIANIAEEAIAPQKTMFKAFLYSLVISVTVYLGVAIVVVHAVPYDQLASAEQPLALVMEKLTGGSSTIAMNLIALFATANTVLIVLIVSARMLYGMANEGSIPTIFSSVHKKRQTPWFAVIVITVASLLFLSIGDIAVLASIADIGIFLIFLFVNLSNIILRYKQPQLNRPWKAPFNIGAFPVLSALGVLSCIGMLIAINHTVLVYGFEISSLLLGLIVFASAIPLYYLLNTKK